MLWRVICLNFRLKWLEFILLTQRNHTMSELRIRMTCDLVLAGLAEGTRKEYLRAVYQLAAYYMIPPDRLTERQVQDYILYVRDDLGVAKGTFAPLLAGLKFFYLNTLGYDWALFTKKNSQAPPEAVAGRPYRCRLPSSDRHLGKAGLSWLLHGNLRVWIANFRGGRPADHGCRLEADDPAGHRQTR